MDEENSAALHVLWAIPLLKRLWLKLDVCYLGY